MVLGPFGNLIIDILDHFLLIFINHFGVFIYMITAVVSSVRKLSELYAARRDEDSRWWCDELIKKKVK